MGAAFAVLLDELSRTERRWLGSYTVRRLRENTIIVGAIGESGRMITVGGYESKLKAVEKRHRVIAPVADKEHLEERPAGAEIRFARTWHEAARIGRTWEHRARLRAAMISSATLLIVASVVGGITYHTKHVQDVRDTARRVAEKSQELATGGSGGLGLLLAMASDDIAGQAGDQTTVFADMARFNSGLLKILRPPHGVYRQAAITRDGGYALLATSAGTVQLVATQDGTIGWQQDHKPGIELSRDQVRIEALAFSPDGKHAAVSTSDLKITFLRHDGSRWIMERELPFPVPSQLSSLGTETNAAKRISFDPASTTLMAYGHSELFWYHLDQATNPPRRCAAPSGATGLAGMPGGAALVRDTEVVQVVESNCQAKTALTAPSGAKLSGVGFDNNSGISAFATRGQQILTVRNAQAEAVLANRGPYSELHVTDGSDGLHVSANSKAGTFGWKADDATQDFGLRGPGVAIETADRLVWLNSEGAELHHADGRPAATLQTFIDGAVTSVGWAGSDLVARRMTSVEVFPSGGAPLDVAKVRSLPMTPGVVDGLATSRDGPWAAAVVRPQVGVRTLVVWDVPSSRSMQVPLAEHDSVNVAAFSGHRLYVGYRSGQLQVFEPKDERWLPVAQAKLGGGVYAIGSREDNDSIYTTSGTSDSTSTEVSRINKGDFRIQATRLIEGPPGVGGPLVSILDDRQIVVGHGDGIVNFLNENLDEIAVVKDPLLSAVLAVAEVPGQRQLIVSGLRKTDALDPVTHSILSRNSWSGIGSIRSADAASDGRLLATMDSASARIGIWTLRPDGLRAKVCMAIGRDLSEQEWSELIGPLQTYHPVCA